MTAVISQPAPRAIAFLGLGAMGYPMAGHLARAGHPVTVYNRSPERAQSWQMEHRAPTMIAGDFDFGFSVKWMRKDLALCLEEARRNGASLPLAALIDQFYAEIEALGGARWDSSSLIQRLRHASARS
ncbi:2-hydroxy-3-oxopropionate reductase [Burkholderiales bacterium]|nr:2-hydroxy-3-oxopropionate reductase [Burkholderiales bacterium]